ncbi:hypothetical protein GIB67_011764 [Kingdonia uniflora]|uniref:Kinetochore protein SPC25 n=1 Tax=Kingdonia uniflora TaxID=39325 RepID=A0A7J7NXD8_9MAGN|nr:hypothetical protein GIB67_011764 [Kingdonia uniflora]
MDTNQGIRQKEHIQDAISWYNKFLGFRVEGGHGVKFIFNNINSQNPNKEYSFTLRHADDNYTLLDCDPYLGDIQELNQTNDFFKFVRIMREKFQATTLKEILVETGPIQTQHPLVDLPMDKVTDAIRMHLKIHFDTPGAPQIKSLDQFAFGLTRKKTTQLFYQTCVLATHDLVKV